MTRIEVLLGVIIGFTTLLITVLTKLNAMVKETKELRKNLRKIKRVVGVIGQIPEPLASWHVCNSRAQAERSEYVRNLVLLTSINKGDYDYFDFISEANGTSTKIRDPNDTNFWTAVNMEEPC